MKKILIACLLLLTSIVVIFLYFRATYIDEMIIQGEGYGFTIGDSKEIAFEKANKLFQGKIVYISYPILHEESGVGAFYKISFVTNDFEKIEQRDLWKIYFEKSYWDSLDLTFSNGQLVKIYRHRQKFEFP